MSKQESDKKMTKEIFRQIKSNNKNFFKSIYDYNDLEHFSNNFQNNYFYNSLETLDELLERDEQRKKDGFNPKIKMSKIVRPKKNGQNQIAIVPTAIEEKFYHDSDFKYAWAREIFYSDEDDELSIEVGETVGSGKGKKGDILRERPVKSCSEGSCKEAGDEEGDHDIEDSTYKLGKILTKRFKLPNIQDKNKKKSLTKFVYDLTSRNIGSGQILDKKQTFKRMIKSNLGLKIIKPNQKIDSSKLIIGPRDRVYKTFSREKDFEPQSLVFFLRDYSGSMIGKPTELVVTQHVLLYAWLFYQYKKNASSRFIVHDTKAKEVANLNQYYNLSTGGGTDIYTGFALINKIIEEENLAKDYNIYVFYGGDGGDWGDGKKTKGELNKLLLYSNRIGVTIVQNRLYSSKFEEYINNTSIVNNPKFKIDILEEEANENQIIKGIKNLISP